MKAVVWKSSFEKSLLPSITKSEGFYAAYAILVNMIYNYNILHDRAAYGILLTLLIALNTSTVFKTILSEQERLIKMNNNQ